MRTIKTFKLPHRANLVTGLLQWAESEPVCCLLHSNGHKTSYSRFDLLLAVGVKSSLTAHVGTGFGQLSEYRRNTADWLLGFLTYDLKNELEDLKSANEDALSFPDLYFFQPLKIFQLKEQKLELHYLPEVVHEMERDVNQIMKVLQNFTQPKPSSGIKIKMRLTRDAYCQQVSQMLDYIKRGAIYEANFCQEFYAEAEIDPISVFLKLNALSKAPFASFFKLNDRYALCSSPERYLQKNGAQLISQPIKGTSRRGSTYDEDRLLKNQLQTDPKERSENIMITDLVRNDLSRVASRGSVTVPELCKIYTFDQVHQMISTVAANLPEHMDPVNCLAKTFPMGSMTGAPKIRAMQIIEALETQKRGLYSGSIGYFTPEGDFDFNVVIRSILFNAAKNYLSFCVGSAITATASPEKEYEECLVKAKAMREALGA